MQCRKCHQELPANAIYCCFCGVKQSVPAHKTKSRGNGQGSVYKLPNGKYKAVVILGYYEGHKKTASKTFEKKSDAINALPGLKLAVPDVDKDINFITAYDTMMKTHNKKISVSTADCYKYAMRHFEKLQFYPLNKIKTDMLQSCVDSVDGKRTQENMKAVASLIFRYGLKNDIVEKNYAEYITVTAKAKEEREPFSLDEIKRISESAGIVPFADYILCLIFTGFRPNEMFSLEKSSFHGTYFVGGSKTEAGKNRIVPIPNIIMPIVQKQIENDSKYIFPAPNGKKMDLSHFRTRYYYPALEQIGVRALPPYSCRHTFATLLKDINAPATDKQKLMGHTSFEMTAHYTHTDIDSLRRITDKLDIQ